jgi:hypothetical protein
MAARASRLALTAVLLAAAPALALEYPGYEWMNGFGDSNALLTYGSPETGEDYVFSLYCRGNDKATGMSVYVDIVGTKVGDPVAIEFSSKTETLSVPGKITTDEMSGFLFAEAEGFKIKPVTTLLQAKGPVTLKTGSVTTNLPAKGRVKAAAEFAKNCPLD